ncbi:MAG TPA: efflux transporter outer membrane subunit [Caulobacteraceae bacterium]|jgi:NodT family efflux transporter outer membrane factor (OMF) lipoprotein|nr:efflux transporter outer membrane subunit [Caulobacteraceae bacterium]
MSPWNRTAALAAAASLAACTTVGPNFKTPAAPSAPGYAMAGDARDGTVVLTPEARSMGPWWRALGSSRLNAVMEEALADNQTVAKALAALDKARAQADSARGNAGPKVDASASAERERINIAAFGISGFPNPTIDLLSVGAQVSYDLDLFGGNRRRIETAAAAREAEGHRADAAFLLLTGNVAMQAVRIGEIRDQIAAVNAIIADDERNLEIIHAAQAAGGEAPAASTGGEAQLAADRALLPPLSQSLAQARHALAQLVGRSPAEWTAPDFAAGEFAAPAQIPVSLPSTLVRNRPDILAAEADLHADTARIGVATANLYPDIKLAAAWAQSALTPGALFGYNASGWSIGPSLTAPIFNGGALKADKRAAEAQARASLAQYRITVLGAFVQVSDVMSALAHDDERLAALSTSEAVAQAALHDARAAYSLGGGPLSAIDTAQVQVDRARLQLVEARSQRMMDVIQLFAATASDWRENPTKSS